MSNEIKIAKKFIGVLLKKQFSSTPTSPATTRELLRIQASLLQAEQMERIADVVNQYADIYLDLKK